MIKQFQISVSELNLGELIDCLKRIENRLISLEELVARSNEPNYSLNELLSRKEVATYFKVNISTVRNWTKQGILTKYGVGDRVYYKRCEVEEVLTQIDETN